MAKSTHKTGENKNGTKMLDYKDVNLKAVREGKFFCPFCNYQELQVELGSPYFFECLNCHSHIFMTMKDNFLEMDNQINKEITELKNRIQELESTVSTGFRGMKDER